MVNLRWIDGLHDGVDLFPVAYYSGDLRKFAALLGETPHEFRNDLGPYLALGGFFDRTPFLLVSVLPFIQQDLTVLSLKEQRGYVRSAVEELMRKVGYVVAEVPDKWRVESDDSP